MNVSAVAPLQGYIFTNCQAAVILVERDEVHSHRVGLVLRVVAVAVAVRRSRCRSELHPGDHADKSVAVSAFSA